MRVVLSFRHAARAAAVCASVGFSGVEAFAQDASTTSPTTTLPSVVVQSTSSAVKKPSKNKAKKQLVEPAASSAGRPQGETVVVSPTTISTPADQVPSSLSVITSEQLQQEQRRTVPDALASVPGINVVQTGGPGGQTSVFMRGTNSNHVKVIVDGIDVSDPSNFNGSVDFAHLLTGDVDQIEVLRGPQSGLYGSDAIGGVISIITKKGEGPPQAYAQIEGGSFGTFNQATGVSGSEGAFNYALNIQHFRSEDTPVTPNYLVPAGDPRLNNSYDNMTYSTKLGVAVSKDLSFNYVARYVDSTYHYNSLFNYLDGTSSKGGIALPYLQEPEQSTQLNRQFWTRGEGVWSLLDGRFTNYFGVAYTDIWSRSNDPWPADAFTSKYQGERLKYDWRGVANLAPGQVLLTGVEREDDSLNDFPGTHKTGNTAGYVELQSQWGKRLFLDSNVRYDDDDSFGGHTTWRVAPAFIVPGTETKLKGSYGTGFKAPTLTELYVDYPPTFFGNPNLQPEESKGYDVGFEQPLYNDRVRFGATYFHNDIKNLIESGPLLDDNGNPVYYYGYGFPSPIDTSVNVGRAETHGVESFASFAITPTLLLRSDYTYTIATDESTGEELLRRPKNKLSITPTWRATNQLTLSATLNYLSSFKDAYIGNNPVPGYTAPGFTTVNLAANYAVTDNMTLFGRIDNLFDVKYEDPAGYLRPGFGIFAGLKIAGNVSDLVDMAKKPELGCCGAAQ